MATCPKCGGHLTTHHRCYRSPQRRAVEAAVVAVAGGATAVVMAAVFDPRGITADLDLVFFVGGAVIGLATHWLRKMLD